MLNTLKLQAEKHKYDIIFIMNSGKKYVVAADTLRILAILAVIFIHITTRTLEASTFPCKKFRLRFFNQISSFAVPCYAIHI
jgi:surface polysaccharide O-acyltransferase-like enzyme